MRPARSVLVTGGCGFIGWRTAAMLAANGRRVTVIDSMNDAYDVSIKNWRRRDLEAAGISVIVGDVNDQDLLDQHLAENDVDAVVHLAARAGVRASVEAPRDYVEANVNGTLTVMQACVTAGIQRVLLASTSSVYAGAERPYSEVSDSSHVLSPYAATKKAAEVLAHSFHHVHGLDITVVRFFTVYGPAGRPDMSPLRFTQRIYEGRPITVFGDGHQSRDFTFVDDVAAGSIAALDRCEGFNVINLGSDGPVQLVDLIELISKSAGRPAQIRWAPPAMADMRDTWANIARARQLLGWAPRTSLAEGVARMVGWYRQERDWASRVQM